MKYQFLRCANFINKRNDHLPFPRKLVADKEGILSQDKYNPGNFVSDNQVPIKSTGNLASGYFKDVLNGHFNKGTIYNYAEVLSYLG